MPNNQFIGRRVSVGLGIESTPGTEVAPTDWVSQLALEFQRKTKQIQNNSALGRIEQFNDSAIVEEWAEGKLDGKVRDITFVYLLYNLFGTIATTTNADASGNVKDHTLNIAQANTAPTLTIVRKDPITNRRHGLGTVDEIEISGEAGDWIKFTSMLKAKFGVTGTDTPSYVSESEFTMKHLVVKLASTVAGLSGATAPAVKSFKLKLSRPSTPFTPAGQIDPAVFTTGSWDVTGEMVLQYTDTTYEALSQANTVQAMSITMTNTDVTIGTSAHPSLAFTMPRVRLNTFSMSSDLDNVIEQTVGIQGELDQTAGYMIRAVATNLKTLYV